MRPSFLHEIGSKTTRSGIASQPVFTSYKLGFQEQSPDFLRLAEYHSKCSRY